MYAPGSPERAALTSATDAMLSTSIEIPVVIGGQRIHTGNTLDAVVPHDHGHVLARVHQAGADEVAAAAAAAHEAWQDWSRMPFEARAAIFLKAAELLAGPWRQTLNAATLLNQSKTCLQAEIDAACELIDFWRYNPAFAERLFQDQPTSSPGIWNRVEHRPLEGFVLAVTPFNFTSIAGNLPTAPALMGNTMIWKPATTALYSGWKIFELLEAAGLPPGVINFVPGRGGSVGNPAIAHPDFAGVHFTGSTSVFQGMWKKIGESIAGYATYPRIVGETGGKDFIFAHESADIDEVAAAAVRGAFEYQGQKCSAASRLYAPRSRWPELRDRMVGMIGEIRMGDPSDFGNFMAAVIDESSFDKLHGAIEQARSSPEAQVLAGGGADKSQGYFIEPTLIETTNPKFDLMCEELFGPVLTVFVYDEGDLEGALALCDSTSPYALTGGIFARDRNVIVQMSDALRFSAGNFYINDKPTGAVVGQQPFGGSRASGTNDKAGSMANLMRWTSQRSIKETFVPPQDFRYPHMD